MATEGTELPTPEEVANDVCKALSVNDRRNWREVLMAHIKDRDARIRELEFTPEVGRVEPDMPVQFDPRDRLQFFQDWKALQEGLDHSWETNDGRLSLSWITAYIGVELDPLLTVLTAMEEDGLIKLYLKVYHTCEEYPVDHRLLLEGFHMVQVTMADYICPDCEEETEFEDLSFDVEAVFTQRVTVLG